MAVTETTSASPASKGLKVGALGLLGSIVGGVASTAPAYSLAASLGYVVVVPNGDGIVGVKAPLVMIPAFIPMYFIAVAYAELNRAEPDCGSTFTWAVRPGDQAQPVVAGLRLPDSVGGTVIAPDLSNLPPGATAVDLETGREIHLEPGQRYVDETPEETAARDQTDEQPWAHSSTGSVAGMPACPGPATVVFEPTLTEYDFGPSHPMSPIRVDLTMRLARELGVLEQIRTVPAPMADDDLIATVHEPAMIEAVMLAGKDPGGFVSSHGLGSDDNPVFHDMHRAASHVVGATAEAFRQVWSGESLHSANITGGLHHAMPDRASGFCIYNDIAIGIRWLLANGATKVAYVDVDVHHGDGVEKIFYDDPRVLTISLHETGQTLFPGTGFPQDSGGPDAQGSAVNVALPPGTADAGWLRAFHAVVPPLLREFAPDILVTQHGCDSHRDDPLADLMLSVDGQRASYLALHDLAHEVCDGKWVVTGGGGYALVEVVPRAWTHLLSVVGGHPLDVSTATPDAWREYVRERLGRPAPYRLTDGRDPAYRDWSQGYDPGTWLDRTINATREEIFPLHGLDPLP